MLNIIERVCCLGIVLLGLWGSLPVLAESTGSQGDHQIDLSQGAIANMMRKYDTPFVLFPYEPNYILNTYVSHINTSPIEAYNWADETQKVEVKFQLSLGFPIWRGIFSDNSMLGASYTQRSWWQAYNHKASSPFRETNYEPQIFFAWVLDEPILGWRIKETEIGFAHQSNGRSEPTSRSWNRIYARVMAQRHDWLLEIKPWYRIHESKKNDDNRNIVKYLGYYRVKVGYAWGEAIFSVQGGYNWSSGYGGTEFGVSYPLTKKVRIYAQGFSGYGESMIDYNQKETIRYGIGVMLNDLF